jgi:SulP family sulfate permease
MMGLVSARRFRLPLPPIVPYRRSNIGPDALAAVATMVLAVPQGLAYATIAGLPPAMGLYASAVPTIIGSLFRSSRHVISGPTNALSLLVGGATAIGLGGDPAAVALTLALMVGVFQAVAGVLRLGALVDFISSSVVLGYITGAGVLIGVGQLHNLTATPKLQGHIWDRVGGWVSTLDQADPLAVGVALGTIVLIVAVRLANRKLPFRVPSAIAAVVAAVTVNLVFGLESRGLRTIADLSPIPAGLPEFTVPNLDSVHVLLPAAIACTVLSLVESTSLARSIASRTGQRLEASTEFFGQGLSNVAAAFFGGYPVSGSLSRSALNERVGAQTRLAGMLSGVLMVAVLLVLGPLLDHTPIASLAGLLVVLAVDLVDRHKIRRTMRASHADALAFSATVLGTWVMSLDLAIYLGVGISLALFLRNARLLKVRELVIGKNGVLEERTLHSDPDTPHRCHKIRMLHVEGALFFGAAGELQSALDEAARDPEVRVIIVRVKRTRGLDFSTATVFEAFASLLREQGRHLLLVGMTPEMMDVLESSGTAEAIGVENLFPTRKKWFSALDAARDRAVDLCGEGCDTCPFASARFTAQAETDHESGRFRSLKRRFNDLKQEPAVTADSSSSGDTG